MGKGTHFFGQPVYGQLIKCLNKDKVSEQKAISSDDLLNGKYILVQKGKKNYYLIIVD